jgi:hypothetical protein
MNRIALLSAAIVLAVLITLASHSMAIPEEPPAKPKVDPPKEAKSPKWLKLPTLKEAMAIKLKSSQSILEGIAINDHEKIEAAAEDLIKIIDLTEFLNAYKGAEYKFYVKMFRQPAETIVKKAQVRSMDGVMLAYNDLTQTCLKCHQAMRDKKFEIRHESNPERERGE